MIVISVCIHLTADPSITIMDRFCMALPTLHQRASGPDISPSIPPSLSICVRIYEYGLRTSSIMHGTRAISMCPGDGDFVFLGPGHVRNWGTCMYASFLWLSSRLKVCLRVRTQCASHEPKQAEIPVLWRLPIFALPLKIVQPPTHGLCGSCLVLSINMRRIQSPGLNH